MTSISGDTPTTTDSTRNAAAEAAGLARDRARAWGRDLLNATPWLGLDDRVTLVVTSPAPGVEVVPPTLALWLVIDAPTARALPPEYQALITTDAAVERLLQALTPRSIEARWQWRHVEIVMDRLRRAEQFGLRAGMLPDDGPERMLRPLWSTAHASARALEVMGTDRTREALVAAGEIASSLARIACVMDEGAYPPVDVLLAVARETRIGKRIGPWLDDLIPALGGDEAAARRILGSRDQALTEVAEVMAERFRARPWLADPESFALRTPR